MALLLIGCCCLPAWHSTCCLKLPDVKATLLCRRCTCILLLLLLLLVWCTAADAAGCALLCGSSMLHCTRWHANDRPAINFDPIYSFLSSSGHCTDHERCMQCYAGVER
jgi:hypothetical protein